MAQDNAKALVFLVLLAGLLIVTPYFFRMWQGNPYSINSETYNILRLYNTLDNDFYDDLQDRNVMLNILYFLPFTEDYGFFMTKIIVFLLALLSIIFGYLIMKRHNFPDKVTIATLLLLMSSPIFISTFIDFSTYSITVFLGLLSIYFLSTDKRYISAIIGIILPFIDLYSATIMIIIQALYILSRHNSLSRHKALVISGILAIITSIIINIYLGYNVFSSISIAKSNIITEIGASSGFSFSSLLLSIIGLVLLWERTWKNIAVYSMIILLLISAIFLEVLRVYLNFVLVIYGGFAFVYLTRRKWSIGIIKRITLLLIVCSILFTTLVFITNNIKSEPNSNYVEALVFLNKQSMVNETVFSSEDNGYIIEYYAERASFVDQKSGIYDPEKIRLFENLSISRNLEKTESILKQHSIKYIFIDSDFQRYLEDKEGLLFLISTSNKFRNIYRNEDIEIWMYTE
jgi:hypothetical protein